MNLFSKLQKNPEWILISILVLFHLIVRFILLSKSLLVIDSYAIPDDAYLCLTIARNIADGKGFLYGDSFTNGFQPLYVFIMAPVFLLLKGDLIAPIYISLIFLNIVSLFSLYLVFSLIKFLFNDIWSAFLVSLFYIFTPVIIRNTSNGMETSVSFFFFLLLFYVFYKYMQTDLSNISSKKMFFFGVLSGAGILARFDILIAVACIAMYFLCCVKKTSLNLDIKRLLFFVLGIILVYSPWMLLSYIYTGDIYHISGKSVQKQADSLLKMSTNYLPVYINITYKSVRQIILNYWCIGIYSLVLAFMLKSVYKSSISKTGYLRKHIVLITTSALMFLSYTYYIKAFWYFDRYLFPLLVIFLILTGYFVHLILSNTANHKTKRIFLFVSAIVIIGLNVLRPNFYRYFYKSDFPENGYYRIGNWVSQNFDSNTVVGSLQTGALAYFAKDVKIINLDGVVNKESYDAVKNSKLMDYIRSKKIEYVVGWNLNYDFIKYSSDNFKEDDLILIKKIEGIKSYDYDWYLYKVNYR
ncbi:MAG: hypothetical protein PHN88_08005 [Ignavibacteria bacterium]|nr:hypothetical protein [Ignavibacteria bacterium]